MRIQRILMGLLIAGATAPLSPIAAQTINSSLGGLTATPTEFSPTSVVWNPAIVGRIEGTQIESNVALFGGYLNYERSGTDPNTEEPYQQSLLEILVPNPILSLTSDFGFDRLGFGYTTYFPSGIRARFDEEGPQRYDVINGFFLPWNHQLSMAYQINSEWTVGAGAIVSVAFYESELDVDLSPMMSQVLQVENLPQESPALSSRVHFDLAQAIDATYTFGALYTPTPHWRVGLSFVGPLNFNFHQDLNLNTPPLVSSLGAASPALGLGEEVTSRALTKRYVPAHLQSGVFFRPFSWFKTSFYGRYILSSLTRFTEVEVTRSDLAILRDLEVNGSSPKDSYTLVAKQEFGLTRQTDLGLVTSYYANAVEGEDVATSRIDFDTFLLGIFARYRWTPQFQIGAEYSHSFMFDRKIRDAQGRAVSPLLRASSTAGTYEASFDRLALNLQYVF